jgi:hypothetical protein
MSIDFVHVWFLDFFFLETFEFQSFEKEKLKTGSLGPNLNFEFLERREHNLPPKGSAPTTCFAKMKTYFVCKAHEEHGSLVSTTFVLKYNHF